MVDVEAQQFPQPFERVLRAIVRIVGRAAVTGRNVKIAIGAELERAPVVIGERLRKEQQLHGRCGIGAIRVRRAHVIARDDRCAIAASRVIDEEESVVAKVRMKRKSEQPLLAAKLDEGAEVKQRRGDKLAVLGDTNASGLLDDEQPSGPVARVRDVDRTLEARQRRQQSYLRPRGRDRNQKRDANRGARRECVTPAPPVVRRTRVCHFLSESRISRNSTTSSGGVGGALGSSRFNRLICFTIKKMMNARMRKLIATVMKFP